MWKSMMFAVRKLSCEFEASKSEVVEKRQVFDVPPIKVEVTENIVEIQRIVAMEHNELAFGI